MTKSIPIIADTPQLSDKAQQLASELGLPFMATTSNLEGYALMVGEEYLGIRDLSDPKTKPFYVDFLSGKLRHRWQQAGLKREALAKAIGAKPKDQRTIVDATAGLGRDGFILAALGFSVTLLERSPIVFALLRDALQRAAEHELTHEIAGHIQLHHTDATTWLKQHSGQVDIIYLDPMFPGRNKSAQVKKDMVILQNLLGKDEDSMQLFNTAIACAGLRVVVKRPRLAQTISEKVPSFTLKGTSSRFDIYMV